MKFSRCCCFGLSDESPSRISFTNKQTKSSVPVSPLAQYPPEEPGNERISRHGRVQISKSGSDQVAPVTVKTSTLQQPATDDFSSLYATVDRSRKTSRRSPILITRTSATPPSRPTPTDPIYQRHTNFNDRFPHYEQVIVRESLHHRDQRLQTNGPVGTSTSASNHPPDFRTMSGSDIYAEIGNNSGSGTYYPPSARFADDSSERYATIPDHDEGATQLLNGHSYPSQF